MLTVEDYGRIRRAHRDGLSIRAIARTFHHSRRSVRQALERAEPRPYTRTKEPEAPKLGPFRGLIDQILKADKDAPPKQRHTAAQIFRRLRDEHSYPGGYDQVRRYVKKRRNRHRETFIPLSHDPGQRLEADFGHIYVDFPEGRQRVSVLVLTWSYSNCPFAIALPTERIEAVLTGMVAAFDFFGCVAHEVWWDNAKTVVCQILKGRHREVHESYSALASHYRFEPLFCMPGTPTEKARVENRVFDLQRRWATPVPRKRDLEDLNEHLRIRCLDERKRIVSGETKSIGERFEEDHQAALPLPPSSYDPCIRREARASKYQTVAFDSNRYSVPRKFAFERVTVKAYVDRIEVVAQGQVVAKHPRCYGHQQQILDPVHYLVTLGRRPASLDHSSVYRDWHLPACFDELRTHLEERHGSADGARRYIRVLQLLAEHPSARVARAIEYAFHRGAPSAELICSHVGKLAAKHHRQDQPREALPDLAPESVRVPSPDLGRFNQLLHPGG